MTNFYLFFIHEKLKDLLLEELKINHPQLRLSFSNKEILSMKGPLNYEAELTKNPVIFARRMAHFVAKTDIASEFSVKIKDSEYWNYKLIHSHADTYDLAPNEKPDAAPSRAWHKIEEACRQFNWEIPKGDSVIEIGSAPGGISYFLLEQEVKLCAIDPAQMDDKLKKFKHIKRSVFDVEKIHLPKTCDWIVSDLNLNGDLNVGQCKRIADFYPNLKGGFLTIKTPDLEDLKLISNWEKVFRKFETYTVHLPSHRREIGLFFKRG